VKDTTTNIKSIHHIVLQEKQHLSYKVKIFVIKKKREKRWKWDGREKECIY